jgi:N6-adenosine-specific RNA methylase IME4
MPSALTIAKQMRRAQLEAGLSARILAFPTKQYGVGLADPGWWFEPYSRLTGMDRAADNHYATSPLEQIKALDVLSIMAPDSVMFLWTTVPMLMQAGAVLAAWEFACKSHFTWVKTNADGSLHFGTGYCNRNAHEILLVGTRGMTPTPASGTQWSSVLFVPVGRRSEKPVVFYELIDITRLCQRLNCLGAERRGKAGISGVLRLSRMSTKAALKLTPSLERRVFEENLGSA